MTATKRAKMMVAGPRRSKYSSPASIASTEMPKRGPMRSMKARPPPRTDEVADVGADPRTGHRRREQAPHEVGCPADVDAVKAAAVVMTSPGVKLPMMNRFSSTVAANTIA